MSVKLENQYLALESNEKGAELISIRDKKDNTEYLWNGNPEFWGRHAPILFPIVGRLKNNQYKIDGKTYNLGQHGFARDFGFDTIENSKEKALFRLCWSEETLKIYPYKFRLDVEYYLKDNTVEVRYIVKNIDNHDIYFSIGAHPGFNCPLVNEESNLLPSSFEDYYFEFENKEDSSIICINEYGFLKKEKKPFLNDSNIIQLTKDLFKEDALIFNKLKSQKVSLRNTKNSKAITVDFTGFPYIGLWSKPEGAPFVCIEPWFGHADFEDFDGNFSEKDGILKLSVEEEFSCKYCISISK
jgi:galactose mutarotase-like enzyme